MERYNALHCPSHKNFEETTLTLLSKAENIELFDKIILRNIDNETFMKPKLKEYLIDQNNDI